MVSLICLVIRNALRSNQYTTSWKDSLSGDELLGVDYLRQNGIRKTVRHFSETQWKWADMQYGIRAFGGDLGYEEIY